MFPVAAVPGVAVSLGSVPGQVQDHGGAVRSGTCPEPVYFAAAQDVCQGHGGLGGHPFFQWCSRGGAVQVPSPLIMPDHLREGAGVPQQLIDARGQFFCTGRPEPVQHGAQVADGPQFSCRAGAGTAEALPGQEGIQVLHGEELVGSGHAGVDERRRSSQGICGVMS